MALDLLEKLLILNPESRISATEGVNHAFFNKEPLACSISQMPRLEKEEIHGIVKKNENDEIQQKIGLKEKSDLSDLDTVTKKVKTN